MTSSSVDEISQPGAIDLWCYFPASNPVRGGFADQVALLNAEELARAGEFRLERERRVFIATRALVRTVLSRYFPVAPDAWQFVADRWGRPAVASPPVTPRIFFNLAHAEGLIACGVSAGPAALGVDVEQVALGRDFSEEAEEYLAESERAALRACAVEERSRLFLAYWTLKESYAKARGEGAALPFEKISFCLENEEIGVVLDRSLADDGKSWRFALCHAASHTLAVAARTAGAPLRIRARGIVPRGGTSEVQSLAGIWKFPCGGESGSIAG